MGIRIVAAAAVLVTVGSLAPALAADPAGEAVAVTPAAAASGAAGSRTLATHGSVFMGDLVTTDAGGQAQLKFLDDTRMVVGPNSQLTIDKFVYAGGGTAKQVTFEATRGVFRFITGNSPKSAYLIDTPVATIGARGSHGDFILPGDGTLSVVFYSENGVAPDEHGLYVCDKPDNRPPHLRRADEGMLLRHLRRRPAARFHDKRLRARQEDGRHRIRLQSRHRRRRFPGELRPMQQPRHHQARLLRR